MPTIQVAEGWFVRKPPLFRYMDLKYVEAFFETGALRLSSFLAFSRHSDEQRQDTAEGRTLLFARQKNGLQGSRGGTRIADTQYGLNAYILCGSLRLGTDIAAAFGSRSGVRINDAAALGSEVAKQLPGRIVGFEGYCLYQDRRVLDRKVDCLDRSEYMTEGERPTGDLTKLDAAINRIVGLDPFFVKETKYALQQEYRLVWQLEAAVQERIDIIVPDARKFCERFEIPMAAE